MNGDIFTPRVNILPYEYPQLLEYKDAIRHSYWIDTEFNFTEDIQDFKVTISEEEKDIIRSNKGTEFANVLKKLFGDNLLRGIVLSNPKETVFRKGGLATR